MWISRHHGGPEEPRTRPAWLIHSIKHAIAAGLTRTACSLGLQSCSGQAASLNPSKHFRKEASSSPAGFSKAHCAPHHDPHSTPSRRVVIHDGGWSFLGLVAAQMGRCDHQTGSRNPNDYFGKNAPCTSSVPLWKTHCKMVPTKMPALPPSRAHQHATFMFMLNMKG